jgi:putative transposase
MSFLRFRSKKAPQLLARQCSACRALSGPQGEKDLNIREWDCACGASHNRDTNSAINILRLGH